MSSWFQVADFEDFKKWAYKDSPYRVIADLGDRGHHRVLFTSSYGPPNKLVRGNLGGGVLGMSKATAIANEFMEDNKYGCPPPAEIEL